MAKVIHDVYFRVPNNRTGLKFIEQCRKYVNRDKYSRVLSRPRDGKRCNNSGDTEREGCKSFAVYLAHSQAQIDANYARQARQDKIRDGDYIGRFKHQKELNALLDESKVQMKSHRKEVDELKILWRTAQANADMLMNQRAGWKYGVAFLAIYSIVVTLTAYFWI